MSAAASPAVGQRLTYAEALVAAVADEMRADPDVLIVGQDIGPFGGSMQGDRGLWEEFGPRRVIDMPISESAMVGLGIGAALRGLRPIVEISFGEFLSSVVNQVANQAIGVHYGTGARLPLVIRSRLGDGPYRGHPQCFEAWFTHLPGLVVAMPSTPADAYTMLRWAVRDDNPVLFLEHMYLYHSLREEVRREPPTGPLPGVAVRRAGRDVTVAATARMVHQALSAARQLEREGVDVEVVDVRVLAPLEPAALLASVRKTGHLVVAHEAWKTGGFGGEVAAVAAEEAFDALRGPVVRVGAQHVYIPSAKSLRDLALPRVGDIVAAVHKALGLRPAAEGC